MHDNPPQGDLNMSSLRSRPALRSPGAPEAASDDFTNGKDVYDVKVAGGISNLYVVAGTEGRAYVVSSIGVTLTLMTRLARLSGSASMKVLPKAPFASVDPTSTAFMRHRVEEVAQRTHIDNLWYVPAGPVPHNPADLLQSESFKRFIERLGQLFDRVIIDSPPVAAVADSAIVSTLVDGCVFVIRAFTTSRHLSRQGLRSLLDVGAPVLGAVLNAVDLEKHHSYYQYYSYKRDGYGPRVVPEAVPESSPALPPN
jgi:capsular exopolysaccharide synthesis family protein